MIRPSILVLEPKGMSSKARKVLESFAHVEYREVERESLSEAVRKVDGVMTRLFHSFDANVLTSCSTLKAIATPTTGLDHIDLQAAAHCEVAILSLRGQTEFLSNIHATSEHTIALLLALARKIPSGFDSVKAGNWDRGEFLGSELFGKRIGIIGLGRVGKQVAQIAIAFGMEVVFYDTADITLSGASPISLLELVRTSDIVSVHAPANAQTNKLIDRKLISEIKKGSLFVNTSRGTLVDEQALLDAARRGDISGFALDVIADEVQGKSISKDIIEFCELTSRGIVTPHLGGWTSESIEKTELFIANKLKEFFSGNFVAELNRQS